jgi:hypothetical protein
LYNYIKIFLDADLIEDTPQLLDGENREEEFGRLIVYSLAIGNRKKLSGK